MYIHRNRWDILSNSLEIYVRTNLKMVWIWAMKTYMWRSPENDMMLGGEATRMRTRPKQACLKAIRIK